MRAINVNLLGDRPGAKLPIGTGISIDPSLIIVIGLGLICAFAIPGLAGWAIDSFMIAPTQSRIDEIKNSIGQNKGKASAINARAKQAEELEADFEAMSAYAHQSFAWRSVLEEIRDLVPTDMWLTMLTIDSSRRLHLEGRALDYRAIAYFYTNLQNATTFSAPILGNLTSSQVEDQSLVEFSVDCTIQEGV